MDLVFGNDEEIVDYFKKVTNMAEDKSVLNVQQSTEEKSCYIKQNHHTTNTGMQFIVNNAFCRGKHDTAIKLKPIDCLFHLLLSNFANKLKESQRHIFVALLQYATKNQATLTIPDHLHFTLANYWAS